MMQPLTDKDYELIAEAQRVIRLNYDAIHENHTVGAAVREKSGKIFAGVNMYSMHGACAEQIASELLSHKGNGTLIRLLR